MNLDTETFGCFLTINRKHGAVVMSDFYADGDMDLTERMYSIFDSYYAYAAVYWRTGSGGEDGGEETEDRNTENPETENAANAPNPNEGAGISIPGKPGCLQIPVSRVDATSYIENKEDPTRWAPWRMTDGDETTAWQFSTKTTKLGKAYAYFDFESPVTFEELWIKNGFWKITDGKDQYTRNCRIKKMTIETRKTGSSDYVKLKTVTLKDDKKRKDWQVIELPAAEDVTGVRIRIDSVYKGSKFKTDVCVSEIMFVRREAD